MTACLGGVACACVYVWGEKSVPDFVRKSILLFFGAVGYFVKKKKPFNSIFYKREKKRKKKKSDGTLNRASRLWTCNL